MRLDDDERGEYRRQPVSVGGVYAPPDHRVLPSLMAELVQWLRDEDQGHTLVRAGLAHLNVVSIHPCSTATVGRHASWVHSS